MYQNKRFVVILISLTILLLAGVRPAMAAGKDDPVESCERAAARADYADVARQAEALMERGDRTGSARDRAFASAYLGASAVAKGEFDHGFRLLSSAREWAKENANDTVMALALNGLGIHYVMSENNMVVALRYLEEARHCADRAHARLLGYRIDNNVIQIAIIRNDTTMLSYAERCFEEAEDLPAPHARYITARHIARLLILTGDTDRALHYLDRADRLGGTDDRDRMAGEMLRGEIYIRQGRTREAEASYRRALEMDPSPQQKADAFIGLARVANAAGRHADTKDHASKTLKLARSFDLGGYEADAYELLSEACAATGQWQDAYHYADLLNECIARDADAEREYIQRQITTAMQVEKKEQEAEMRRQEVRQIRRRNIILIIALLVVAGLSVVLALEIRKKNRLYRRIVRQLQAEVGTGVEPSRPNEDSEKSKNSENSEHSELSGNLEPPEDSGDLSEELMSQLWETLTQKMEETGAYRSQGLTRETLARMIGTNRTYLSRAIQTHTGAGYTEFINTYRINEAIRVLSDKTRADYPLKALSQDIGFSSITTFYRLFKQRTGMTPSTFRKNA